MPLPIWRLQPGSKVEEPLLLQAVQGDTLIHTQENLEGVPWSVRERRGGGCTAHDSG